MLCLILKGDCFQLCGVNIWYRKIIRTCTVDDMLYFLPDNGTKVQLIHEEGIIPVPGAIELQFLAVQLFCVPRLL